MQRNDLVEELRDEGFCVLKGVFGFEEIQGFLQTCADNVGLMGRTRDENSYHLAGFHRFHEFSEIHEKISSNSALTEVVSRYFLQKAFYAIGLSDITINRSQEWHTDLLRGKYSCLLKDNSAWSQRDVSCVKALVYLQSGNSLRIVPCSHLSPSPLNDEELQEIGENSDFMCPVVEGGDVIMMDIRTLHRGSTEDEMRNPELRTEQKVLISTVFGNVGSEFARAMQVGNACRMAEWDLKYLELTREVGK